jgi:hypothetical protein
VLDFFGIDLAEKSAANSASFWQKSSSASIRPASIASTWPAKFR